MAWLRTASHGTLSSTCLHVVRIGIISGVNVREFVGIPERSIIATGDIGDDVGSALKCSSYRGHSVFRLPSGKIRNSGNMRKLEGWSLKVCTE